MDARKVFELISDNYNPFDSEHLYLSGNAPFKVQIVKYNSNLSAKTYLYQLAIDTTLYSATTLLTSDTNFNSNYIDVPADTKVYFRTTDTVFNYSSEAPNYWWQHLQLSGQYYFKISGADNCHIKVGGDPKSLLNYNELTNWSFYCLFRDCTLLQDASDLKLTASLAPYCYMGMFLNCTSLTSTPSLLNTTLAEGCYYCMFKNCSSLNYISNLPATTIPNYAYLGMFMGCSMVNHYNAGAGFLPATSLGFCCYAYMFKGCGFLSTPNLPATSVNFYSYYHMFENNTSLVNIPILSATSISDGCYGSMFYGCTSLQYYDNNFSLPATTLKPECYVCMFQNCTSLTSVPYNLLPATSLASGCYGYMFRGCTSLRNAPNLPASEMAIKCYQNMFYGCTSLTAIPNFHINTTESHCCLLMFYGCTSITSIPSCTPTSAATTFKLWCYSQMFWGCTNLKNIEGPILGFSNTHSGSTLLRNCFSYMFRNCTNLLYTPNLPATSLASGCYMSMFAGCTNLKAASPLPATSLPSSCYFLMFNGCSSLSSLSAAFSTWPTNNATTNWLYGINTTGVYYGPSGLPDTKGVSNIPTTWTKSPLHFGGQVYLDMELRNYFDASSHRNIIALKSSGNNIINGLVCFWPGTDWYRLEVPVTLSANTTSSFTLIFDTNPINTITHAGNGSIQGDEVTGLPYLPKRSTEDYIGLKDIDLLLSLAYSNKGYTQIRLKNSYSWRKNDTGSWSLSTTPIPFSVDKITLSIWVLGYKNNTWEDWSAFTVYFYMSKEDPNPLTLWSTVGNWNLNIKNPRNLEFYYQILNGSTITYEHANRANPLSINVPKNYYLKIWNRGRGLNTSDLTKLCQFSSTPTNVKVNMSGQFTSLSGLNPFNSNGNFVGFAQPYMYYGLCSGWTALGTISSNTILPPKLTYATTSVVSTYYPTMSSQILSAVPSYYCTNMFKGCTGLSTGGGWDSGLYNNVVLGVHAFESMFSGCTALTSFGSTLSITGVREYSCSKMFMGCTALQNINLGIYSTCNLNVAFSRSNAFSYMFAGCTNLKNNSNGISIFVTNPDYLQYRNMFQGCQSMTVAPNVGEDDGGNFNANTRAYAYMFSGCTSLTNINIDAFGYHTTVAAESYAYMFALCTNLNFDINYDTVQAYNTMFMSFYDLAYFLPKLQNISISGDAYKYMFYKCLNLTVAPILYSTNTYTNSYQYMFCECLTLSVIVDTGKIASGNSLGSQYTYWLEDASPSGVLHICCTGCDVSVEGIRYYLPSLWAIHFLQ